MSVYQNNIKPIIAALFSLIIPGLGQIYVGKWKRGIGLFLGITAQLGIFYGLGMNNLLYWMGLVWLWNIWDAFNTASDLTVSPAGPIIVIVILNLVAALNVTQFQIPTLQPAQRQVIGNVLSGLTRPDIASKKMTEEIAYGKYAVSGTATIEKDELKSTVRECRSINITPQIAKPGQKLKVTGYGFTPNSTGILTLRGSDDLEVARFKTDANGKFTTEFTNPRELSRVYMVKATVYVPAGGWEISEALREAAPKMLETIYLALLGTALSVIIALPLSFFGARNLMSGSKPLRIIYWLVRGLFTVLRSVEVLIIAVIAVAAVGIGPFAGVIALAIHGIGAIGKLYSEAIESIEHGPIEAVRSTGASETQTVIFGVIPQVVPQFIAFTLYRWDINVRMATVIGLVGGGGIGYQLVQYMGLWQWSQAATAIWLIAGVVMIMDYASAVIRERIM